MRFFFRSRQFKIILTLLSILLVLSIIFGIWGSKMSPQTDIASTISAPFKSLATSISNGINDLIDSYKDNNKLMLENAELNSEIDSMREKIADYNKISKENENYKKYLEIKEQNPDFKFCDAVLISKDSADPYGGFTINRGRTSEISLYDPVITDAGLVGYITEIGTTTAKVTTILSPDITMGALDNRTNDSGTVSGNIDLANKKMCRFSHLSRTCSVAIGDYVVTSGEGIFPEGLLIGSIESIGSDKYNTSIYADITPFADLSEIREVMVITEFEGQGGIKLSGGK